MSMLLIKFSIGNRKAVVIASSYEEASDLLNGHDDKGDDWRQADFAQVVCSVYPQLKPHVLAME